MSLLGPEEFPFWVPAPLVDHLRFDAGTLARAYDRADAVGLPSGPEEGRWLVGDAHEAQVLLVALKGVLDNAQRWGSIEERAHSPLVAHQVELTTDYLKRGWRPGRCVAWRISGREPSMGYRTHLVRLMRNAVEPYLLELGTPVCKGFIRSPGECTDRPVDCRSCLIRQEKNPRMYRQVEGEI